jgi:hypothetical protein
MLLATCATVAVTMLVVEESPVVVSVAVPWNS